MVAFTMYDDIYNYDSGIYEYVYGEIDGGHAVKLLGWGHDVDGKLYWIC